MTKTGRVFLVFLVLAVAGYLLPLSHLQFAHGLLELSIHGQSTGAADGVSPQAATERAHDCHSCLAHHPGASVFSAPDGAKFSGPGCDRHLTVAFVNSLAFRVADSPNKRSPPHRFA